MAKVIVQHRVADFDTWLAVFNEHETARRAAGGTGHTVTRTVGDENSLVVVNEFATIAGAQSFMQDPTLPDAMHRGGVEGAPTVWLVDEASTAAY